MMFTSRGRAQRGWCPARSVYSPMSSAPAAALDHLGVEVADASPVSRAAGALGGGRQAAADWAAAV
jgi:hypothetical protein